MRWTRKIKIQWPNSFKYTDGYLILWLSNVGLIQTWTAVDLGGTRIHAYAQPKHLYLVYLECPNILRGASFFTWYGVCDRNSRVVSCRGENLPNWNHFYIRPIYQIKFRKCSHSMYLRKLDAHMQKSIALIASSNLISTIVLTFVSSSCMPLLILDCIIVSLFEFSYLKLLELSLVYEIWAHDMFPECLHLWSDVDHVKGVIALASNTCTRTLRGFLCATIVRYHVYTVYKRCK